MGKVFNVSSQHRGVILRNHFVIYNEKVEAEQIFYKGFSNGFCWTEGLLLCKYLKQNLGYGDTKTKRTLIEISEKQEGFNYVRSRKTVRNMIRLSDKPLMDTGSVAITAEDISRIKSVRNFKQQKMFLAVILLSKRKPNRGYVNRQDWPLIKKIVSRKITNEDIRILFSVLYDKEFIVPVQSSHKMTFSLDSGEVLFNIKTETDALSVIQEYKKYCGGELGYCANCENEFVKSSPRQAYCPSCGKEKRLEKYRRFNKKRNHTTI